MAINRSSTEYYNLEKVAEVLSVSTAEVNRLREQNNLRGFRDGATWKFNKEEVHAYLAESIRARGGGNTDGQAGDSDFDLADSDASSSSFDLLDAALPDEDQLISAVSAPAKSDLDLAALDQDSDLALAEETQIPSMAVPNKSSTPAQLKEEPIELTPIVEEPEAGLLEVDMAVDLDDDSSALGLALADDHSSVLSAASSSPQLGLAGDSGFDVLVAGEEGAESDVLLVDDEKTEAVFTASEDFSLEPTPKASGDEDSESSSQVIAIDVGLTEGAHDTDPFGGDTFGDFGDFESAVQAPQDAAAATNDPFGASTSPAAFDFPVAAPASVKKSAAPEEEYSTGMLIALVAALVVMLLPGMMMLDTMIHMWSWSDPFTLNSFLMSTIAGLFGL